MKIKLTGHDYRYEVFQIVSLFFEKNQIEFCQEDAQLESVLDLENGYAEANLDGKIEKVSLTEINKKNIKNAIKKSLLKILEDYTGLKMPWGILVGIRPTKIVHEAIKNESSEEEIIEHLQDDYMLSLEKANLTLEVAKNESKFLDKELKSIGLYIGIPFCPTRCAYCSFTSNPYRGNEKVVEEYLEALLYEVNNVLKYLNENGYSFDTFYVGGGTPTSLNHTQLDKLIGEVSKYIDLNKLREFTVEAGRPDSIDAEKLKVLKNYSCSRISINPQTMNEETLKLIGRRHSIDDIKEKFILARELGFDNINMDIIIGLPGEDENSITRTMDEIEALMPDSVTIHTMAIKRASVLNEKMFRGDRDLASRMYDIAAKRVRKMGMKPYYMYRQKSMVSPLENIGYSFDGKECIYNIQMIAENKTIIALGADAITKVVYQNENRIERVANLKDVREYIKRIDEQVKDKIIELEKLTHYCQI
ncbi:Oxygen-independent coproporphyrinogen-III oxidase 2 [Caloramator mitchellensis]|uniref:Oxygen-independent coproporphyrinogen-III oxidase 2 n=1 Tax=Caloramator mitchellensis TaxID=908809 RepID=A0A0R3JVC6_CALMK|nr:coproporphyrinogen dehydrogenase HemZ [Caloramator mitchellensis]KRQ87527.1 Oxygen-independent coproporphyrinogen-III oxidase 2 [Caloramator mitchellensis]